MLATVLGDVAHFGDGRDVAAIEYAMARSSCWMLDSRRDPMRSSAAALSAVHERDGRIMVDA